MPNKIYVATESKYAFKNAAAAARVAPFTPEGLQAGSGQISAPFDFGATSRGAMFRWNATYVGGSGVPSGDISKGIGIFWAACDELTSSGTIALDGNFGSGNARINSSQKTYDNLMYVGTVAIDASGNGQTYRSSGLTYLPGRYGAVVWQNTTSSAISSTSGTAEFNLFPIVDEVQ